MLISNLQFGGGTPPRSPSPGRLISDFHKRTSKKNKTKFSPQKARDEFKSNSTIANASDEQIIKWSRTHSNRTGRPKQKEESPFKRENSPVFKKPEVPSKQFDAEQDMRDYLEKNPPHKQAWYPSDKDWFEETEGWRGG